MTRIQELEVLIPKYAQQYYDGSSEISDEEFDALTDELKELDPNHWILSAPGWGYDPYKDTAGKKVKHLYQTVTGIASKPRKVEDITLNGDINISAKLDGLTIVTYIKNGKIILAVTRGNGVTGKDVTAKVIYLHGSDEIADKSFTGSVRGEAVISHAKWDKYKEKYPDAKNQRNSAAGIINNTTDPLKDLEFIDYVLFSVNTSSYEIGKTHTQKLKWLKKNFKKVVENSDTDMRTVRLAKSSEDILGFFYKKVNETYPCDGLVLTEQEQRSTVKDGLIYYESNVEAFKFPSEIKETLVVDIEWNMSKGNKFIPVLILKPVVLNGATVKRVTGINAANILKNNIIPGKTRVKICRSGEVIPKVEEVIND